MTIMLEDSQLLTIQAVETVLLFADNLQPVPCARREKAERIRSMLLRFKYRTLRKKEQGILRRYLQKVTGISPAQLTRHIKAYRDGRKVAATYQRRRFPQVYTKTDIELLAETDNLHGRLNAAATVKIMRRELAVGDRRYACLATISPSHIYNLRQERRYKEEAVTIEKTKPVHNSIGERRKPEPNGEPGFLRADTVHQGDFGKQKGVYHSNFVDEVTQWEVIVAVEQISEECMEPALEEAFAQVPFRIKNFHSDNGGEYINEVVHQFLTRWKSKQTKGRPRHSNDNGLAETKNGAIIRKHMGYRHIPQPFAARINVFYREHLIPYLNFHRPCAFPKVEMLKNGKKKVTYPSENYMTPYEKLKSLPNWKQYLRPGITPAMLEAQATAKTPNQAAAEMQAAKRKLQKIIGDSGTLPPSLHQ